MTHHPPLRAQWLVSALAPARSHDSVVGDLLEEYRESQVPERGVGAADRWFVRQALGFLWTASAPAAWAMAGNLSARTLLDMSIPSGDLSSRAWITTVIAMGIFAWHGFRLGRSTGRIAGAVPLALAATVLGTMFAYALTFAMFGVAAALDADPRAWAVLREGLDIPAHVVAVIGVVLATAGAAAGRIATGSSAPRASIR